MRVVPNVSACLVHESFECVVDLLRNLCYFDPESAVILYNGGHDPALLPASFPFERYNAVVHPDPRPMSWGRLHGFAFDCIRFALRNFRFETLTIVDSDQLHVRGGYSHLITRHLREHPEVGLLSNRPERIPEGTELGPAKTAWGEMELWRPLLMRFPDGEEKFVHWAFWPGTVLTQAAARDLDRVFGDDPQLQEILERTGIMATEEIVFPTLAALLGYEIGLNPCSYTYNRWWGEVTPEEIDFALGTASAYWVHRVFRQYDNPGRKALRERFHGYAPPGRAPRCAEVLGPGPEAPPSPAPHPATR